MKKRILRLLTTVLAAALLLPLLWWENNALTLTGYDYADESVPAAFDGYRILQVSDLHNCLYGEGQEKLVSMTREAAPDCIVVTGDLIENNGAENAVTYLREAAKLAPIYCVPGNHEANAPQGYARLREILPALGVTLLEDASVHLRRGSGQQCHWPAAEQPAGAGAGDASADSVPGPVRCYGGSQELEREKSRENPALFSLFQQLIGHIEAVGGRLGEGACEARAVPKGVNALAA